MTDHRTHSLSRRLFLFAAPSALLVAACSGGRVDAQDASREIRSPNELSSDRGEGTDWRVLTDEHWKARLSPEAFRVLRQEDTERAFTSPLHDETREGVYHCAGCDLPLFNSATKYKSGTGWPSFWEPIKNSVMTKPDNKLWVQRTEYHCVRCLGHQGHVFNDGPKPTGQRWCNNGVALTFRPA